MEALTKIIPSSLILKRFNFEDLKDGNRNYHYRLIMDKFKEKGFNPQSPRILMFFINNITPEL